MTPANARARIEILQNTAEQLFSAKKDAEKHSDASKAKREALKKVKDIATRAQGLIDRRHRALHDDWYISSETREIKRLRVDGKPGRVGTPVPLATIEKDITDMRVLIDAISALAEDFKLHPPRLVSTSRKHALASEASVITAPKKPDDPP